MENSFESNPEKLIPLDLSDPQIMKGVASMISEHSWGYNYPINPAEEHQKAEYCVGAYSGNKLIGIGILNRFSSPDGKDNGELWFADAVVVPEFRNKGIYTKLYNDRMEYAKNHGGRILSCTDNPLMEKFFIEHGWKKIRDTFDEEGGPCMVFEHSK